MGLFIVTASRWTRKKSAESTKGLKERRRHCCSLYRIFILLSFYIHEYLFRRNEHPNWLKWRMSSASPHSMFVMIILFIFQFQIATNLIKNSVQFFLRSVHDQKQTTRDGKLCIYLCIVSCQRLDQSSRPHTRCDTCLCWTFPWRGFSGGPLLSAAPRSSGRCRGFAPSTWATTSVKKEKHIEIYLIKIP